MQRALFAWITAWSVCQTGYADPPATDIESTYPEHTRGVELARAGHYDAGLAVLLPPGGEAAAGEDRPTMITLAAGVGAVLILGLFPQWLLPAVAGAASAFANLAR